jgi:hypothetical protein
VTGVTAFFVVAEADLPAKLSRLAREAVSDPRTDDFAMLVVPDEHRVLAWFLFDGDPIQTTDGFIADAENVERVSLRLEEESGLVSASVPVLWVWTTDNEELQRIVAILGSPIDFGVAGTNGSFVLK